MRPSTRRQVRLQSVERQSPSAGSGEQRQAGDDRAAADLLRGRLRRDEQRREPGEHRAPGPHRAKYGRRRRHACSGSSGITRVLGDDRHEVRVAAPARDDVQVDVVGDAGAGRAAQVHAQVDAVRPVLLAKRPLEPAREAHQLGELLGGGLAERAQVALRRHHHVPAGVGVEVHHHEAQLAACARRAGPPRPSRRAPGTARSPPPRPGSSRRPSSTACRAAPPRYERSTWLAS